MSTEVSILTKIFFGKFKSIFSKPQQKNFLTYILGLMLPCNKTIQGITEELDLKKNQSSLNRFLTESKWKIKDIYSILFDLVKSKLEDDVYLILDDTLCEKTGKKIKAVARNYDHNENRTILSHSVFCGIIKSKDIILPYDIKLYRRKEVCRGIKFKTKIELAQETIEKFLSLDFKRKIILFDSWYAAAKLINYIGHSAYWISPPKDNRLIKEGNFFYPIKYLFKCIKSDQYDEIELNGKTYFIFEHETEMKDIGLVKIVFTKKKRHSKYVSYFISNMREVGGREILLHYSERWNIEVFFREVKQNLGFGKYQMRKMKGIIKHWCLSAVSYSLLSYLLSSLKNLCSTIGKMCGIIRRNIGEILTNCSVS